MHRLMRHCVHLVAILCLTANTFAWAAHVDAPAPVDGTVAEVKHAHFGDDELAERCGHYCHFGAHLFGLLAPGVGIPLPAAPIVTPERRVTPPLVARSEPPYIPPIA
ncbi:hypothetical protein HKX42_10055 [Salinisphaera sp. USBA-960]|nr:hypothetical protein [Salifodinibacter halophilus]NNC27216.1 hypothetical protein [Salifodinibacter halophilus]